MAQPTLSTYGGILRDPGYEGGLVDMNVFVSETKVNETAVTILSGRALVRGAQDDTCKLPSADTDRFVGFSLRFPIFPATYQTDVVGYAQNTAIPALRKGYVYAIPTENVGRGDAVVALTATGQFGSATTAAAGAGRVLFGKSTWESTTPSGTLGKMYVDLT